MRMISSEAKGLETLTPTSKAHLRSEYFPHSEWDKAVGGFVPTDPLPQPMILGKITVLLEPMIAWKINHGEPRGERFSPDGGTCCWREHSHESARGDLAWRPTWATRLRLRIQQLKSRASRQTSA